MVVFEFFLVWKCSWNYSQQQSPQGTPIFRLQLDVPVTWRVDESWPLTWKLTYHGVEGDDSTSQPITFSNSDFSNWGVFCVYRRSSYTGTWGPWRSYRTVGCHQFEDHDSPCTVGTSDMFVTLEPHETWIHVEEREIEFDLPEDAQTGEVLRYQFEGCKLSWLDWGVKDDHIDTIVSCLVWDNNRKSTGQQWTAKCSGTSFKNAAFYRY